MTKHLTSRNAAFFAAGGVVAALFLGGAAYAAIDTVYKYSTPKTGWYGLSPMAFAPDGNDSADGYFIAGPDHVQLNNGHALGCFTTGVNLPHGAKITAFAAWYTTDTSETVRAWLYRTKVSDGTTSTIAFLDSTDTSSTRKSMNEVVPDSAAAVVNNQQYVYSAGVCLFSVNARYHAGRVTYTYATAGD